MANGCFFKELYGRLRTLRRCQTIALFFAQINRELVHGLDKLLPWKHVILAQEIRTRARASAVPPCKKETPGEAPGVGRLVLGGIYVDAFTLFRS
jgi:hypothetical protein